MLKHVQHLMDLINKVMRSIVQNTQDIALRIDNVWELLDNCASERGMSRSKRYADRGFEQGHYLSNGHQLLSTPWNPTIFSQQFLHTDDKLCMIVSGVVCHVQRDDYSVHMILLYGFV